MEEATPSNSITRKRKGRSQNEDCEADNRLEISNGDSSDECLSLEDSLVFNDTLIALQMMRAQFPKIDKVSLQPFILRSQLYSCILDRTQVDRDLESLRRERVLRIFKLNTGQDDDAIMFLDDYINQIDHVVTNLENKKQDLAVFDCFKTHVIMSKLEPNIRHQELCSLLSSGGKVKDEHVSLLINAGVLYHLLQLLVLCSYVFDLFRSLRPAN
ncbi:hypothetical protein Dimus_032429 [Dionaea muscipula]